ncbi:hypothetical protein BEN47_11205 [Hymenobacter lapidarius]|uniref:DUF1232 domain-containing protein n=1 Tax=Hymenobacter lapidarius TaxID=1908237 RepID=A0A1G1T918_9BACT|nr:hypothetical protein BEN47_11205 [Hymenobacter lapidarius]
MAQNSQTPPTGDNVAGSAIFKKFLGTAEGYIRQPTRMKTLLTDAYKKASDKNDVGTLAHEAWETLQTMFRLIKASMSGEYTGVPSTTVLAAVAVLIYFLSPIDLIPDFIPVLGLLDDVALVAWFSTTLKTEMDKFQDWETSSARVVAVTGSTVQAYAPTDKETHASAADVAASASATASNEVKHDADALDEQAAASAGSRSASTGTTALSEGAVLSKESAKSHGTVDLPGAPAVGGQSATDAGSLDTGGNVR